MESSFKEPTLEIVELVDSGRPQDEIRGYLVSKSNIHLYKRYVDKGILEYNKEDLDTMNHDIKQRLEKFEQQKEENTENEPMTLEIDRKLCEFYAQTFDTANFEKLAADLVSRDNSIPLKMCILMCKIRISIILEDRPALVRNVEEAKYVFDGCSDWESKNRFKVYCGLFHLIKAEFDKASEFFTDSLASFNAEELLSFDKLILYLVFTSLLSFERSRLKKEIIDNPEVRKCRNYLELPECLFNCEYPRLFRSLLDFITYCEGDCFLRPFKEHFCKELKIKGYYQLLLCYQSVHLDKMAQFFNVEKSHVEEDLRNFIVEKKLNCVIDRVDGVVRMRVGGKSEDLMYLLNTGENMLRDIKKSIK